MVRRLSALLATLATSALLLVPADPAAAQVQRLTIVAPAAPGGGWDQTARMMQQALQKSGVARSVRVLNVPGAGGTIGLAQFVTANRGSGDALMVMGLIMVGAVLTNNPPVTLADVTPIARLMGEYEVLVVPAASPFATLADFIEAWRADPGRFAIAGGSAGGGDHMLAGLLARAAGVDVARLNYVPHSGGGESVASILGSQVSAGIAGLGELAPFIETGGMRALAISSGERLPGVDIPTFVEQGIALTLANWRGVVAPPGLSPAYRAALTSVLDRMATTREWQDIVASNRWSDMYLSGAAFDTFLDEEDARARGVLESIGLIDANASAGPQYDRVGPRAVPYAVISGLLVLGMLLGVSTRRHPMTGGAGPDTRPGDPWRWVPLVQLLAALVLLVALLELSGFVVAATAQFWVAARAFHSRRPWRDLLVGFVLSALVYLAFARGLGLSLPSGLLEGLL